MSGDRSKTQIHNLTQDSAAKAEQVADSRLDPRIFSKSGASGKFAALPKIMRATLIDLNAERRVRAFLGKVQGLKARELRARCLGDLALLWMAIADREDLLIWLQQSFKQMETRKMSEPESVAPSHGGETLRAWLWPVTIGDTKYSCGMALPDNFPQTHPARYRVLLSSRHIRWVPDAVFAKLRKGPPPRPAAPAPASPRADVFGQAAAVVRARVAKGEALSAAKDREAKIVMLAQNEYLKLLDTRQTINADVAKRYGIGTTYRVRSVDSFQKCFDAAIFERKELAA